MVGMVLAQRRGMSHLHGGHGCRRLMRQGVVGAALLRAGAGVLRGPRALLLALSLRAQLHLLRLSSRRDLRLTRSLHLGHLHRLRRRAGSGTLLTRVVLAVGAGLGRRAPRSPLALAAAAAAAVRLDVLREVIAAHEPLVADRAGESLFAGVGSKVPLQLIRTCEPLATEKPVANKRSLTRVPAQVGLQMGRLPVDLAAAGYVAAVDVLLPEVDARGTQPLGLLAVGAVAGGAPGVAALRARRRGLADAAAAGARGAAGALGTAGAGAAAGVVMEPETGGPARKHGLVRVLQEVVPGARLAEQVVAGQGEAGRVVGRVVGHLGGVHADADGAADVEPAASRGGAVHVPPAVGGLEAAVAGAGHGIEGPGLVGVAPVDAARAQGGALYLAKNASLVVVVRGLLGAGRAGEVEVAGVLGRRGGARGDRGAGVAAARAAGAARRGGPLCHAGARAASVARVLGRAAAALGALLPGMKALAHGRVRQWGRALAAELVALGGEHR